MNSWAMEEAISEAQLALEHEDVPVGAVVVYNNQIIGRGHNEKELRNNALFHGEIIALNQAVEYLGDWHLNECTLFVTLEPCAMCAGAMLNLRLGKVIIGARDERMGCCGTALNLLNQPGFNHKVEVEFGLEQERCAGLLSQFFALLRAKKK
ncbi:MAG: nucleoside deaminase [Tissierellia bacterium]|nr:nucleoside deaminase [Tissierellia bacterium]